MNWFKKIFKKQKGNLPISNVMPRFTRPRGWVAKVYILQKDLPNVKKGTRFQQDYYSDKVYFHGIPISSNIPEKDQVGIIEFESKDVENNTEWFVPLNDA